MGEIMKKLLIAAPLFLLMVLVQNCGQFDAQLEEFGEGDIFSSAASFANPYQILHVKDKVSRDLDGRFSHDFNKDGVKDLLDCAHQRVIIKDGKNLNRKLFAWALPNPEIKHGSYGGKTKLGVTSCSVVRIKGNHPSVVIGSSYHNPAVGMRIPAIQYLLYNKGDTKPGGLFNVRKQTAVITQEGRTFNFRSAARSVKCTEFPATLVKRGFTPGAMCFYSGYDGPITRGGSGTNTALIKFEEGTGGKAAAIDLTVDSGLPWRGGALGTPLNAFSTFSLNGYRKYDGLHMMDSAFLDYNSDGLPDIITVGQHASIRLSTMRFDSSTEEGISFETSKILQAKTGVMTEFLRVQAFNENDPSVRHKCLLVSGEHPNVYDHVWCYHGRWVNYPLPVNMSRGVRQASIARQSPGHPNIKFRAYDAIRKKHLTFALRKTPGKIDGHIDVVKKTASGLRVAGWACQKSMAMPLNVHVYVGNAAGRGGKMIHALKTDRPSEKGVHRRCDAVSKNRFNIVIPKGKLKAHAGKKLYLHGIQIVREAPGGNDLIGKSGHFKIPKF